VSTKIDRVANIQKSRRRHHKNHQIYSKKWSFALLLLTNPLSYTMRHNISMGVVAIGGPLHHGDFMIFTGFGFGW
jgi:hypothetical protein